MLIVGVVPAPPLLPAASVYRLLTTVMLALPEARLAVGVKVLGLSLLRWISRQTPAGEGPQP